MSPFSVSAAKSIGITSTVDGDSKFFMSFLGLADQRYTLAKESIEILEKKNYPFELAFAFNGLSLATYYLNRPYRAKTSSDRKRGKKGGKPTTVDPKNSFRKR